MQNRIIIYLVICLSLIACNEHHNDIDGWAFRTAAHSGWGILGNDGEVLVPSGTYRRQPSSVVNGMYTVPDDVGGVMLYNIDNPEEPVCERHFYRIGYFYDTVTIAQDTMNGPLSVINRKGETISVLNFPQYDIVIAHNFHDGKALVISKNGKYGYIDTEGALVVPPIYDCAYDYREGKALVGIADGNGDINYQMIDKRGNNAFLFQQNNVTFDYYFSEGLLMYKENNTGRCHYMNSRGETCLSLPDKISDCYRFEKGHAVYHTDNGTGIIDSKGKVVIADIYEDMQIGGKNFYYARKNGRWAVVDESGKALSAFCYTSIGRCHQGNIAVATNGGSSYLIDRSGKQIGHYAQIVDDPLVDSDVPEVFMRMLSIGASACKMEEVKPLPSVQKGETTEKVETAYACAPPPHSVRIDAGWQRIDKRSAFYNEAAKVLSGKLPETDAQNRKMILNYVEHLRTSYTTKDIDFLNQLFSENALIVVGRVIKTSVQKESQYLPASQVVYNVKSKQEYLAKLKLVFALNKQIQLHFSDFRIMRHPTSPGIYGVSLRQHYSSDRYSDDGYLFLLWDFRNETEPKIHVRTWQPYHIDSSHTLSDDDVFNIRDFNLQ
jgi:hypothetical protein